MEDTMRVAVIILSLFAGLVMHDYAVIPMRLSILIGSEQRPHEAQEADVPLMPPPL
jgi:hypothetical protein